MHIIKSTKNANNTTTTSDKVPCQYATDFMDLYDSKSPLLHTLLLLDIIILDKLHNKTNLSLLLIHLRSLMDKNIDSESPKSKAELDKIFVAHDDAMTLILKNDNFFDLTALKVIYNDMIKPSFANNDLSTNPYIIDSLLCCSDSLNDFKYFKGIFDSDSIKSHHLQCIKSHFLANAFGEKKNKDYETTNQKLSNIVTEENLSIVRTQGFIEFHLQRWEALNLLDRHIFK